MRDMNVLFGRVAIVATALFALSASAGIKYWDNPAYRAFDVDCYVPGAVWNYDGIRNQGATAAHDNAATTWVNLGSNVGFGGDAQLTSKTVGTGTAGEWADDGYVFRGKTRWYGGGKVTVAGDFTVQMLVDADATEQLTTGLAPACSVMIDNFAFGIYDKNSFLFRLDGTYDGPKITAASKKYDYANVIRDDTNKKAYMFSGTEMPESGEGYRQYATAIGSKSTTGYGLGSTSSSGQQFVGKLKFFRLYQGILSSEELAWNRVVDERRFFDRAAPLPVTNAVVVSTIAASAEPAGCYAVDENGYTFTAPRIATVGNAKYICTGYTLETWDAATGDWGEAVFHARELSCKVEDTDCVRITWKWTDGEGLATYDVSDYVWDGLEVFYDGICNQGTNVAHSTIATNWVNLGSAGSPNDIFLQRLNAAASGWDTAIDLNPTNGRDPGYWTDNGFRMEGSSRFRCNDPGGFTVGKDYSLQMLIDAKTSEQGPAHKPTSNSAVPFGANLSTFAFQIRKNSNQLQWKCFSSGYPYLEGDTFDYMTAIMRPNNKQTFFDGTTEPTSGNGYKENTSASYSDTGFCLGGYGKTGVDDIFIGTIKSFRQYDHALTAAEVAQNRKVDDWRYFGKFAETDVIVQSTYSALQGNEPDGEYDVDGSHTFTAPANVTIKVNGKEIEYACAGYMVENGMWDTRGGATYIVCSNAQTVASTSYGYSESAGLVRLTWLWKPVRGLRTAADYSYDDYSQAGLVWNYDGIYNAGVGTHDSNAANWKNLGDRANSDLHWNGATSTGHWTDDGYVFAGGPRFKGNAGFILKNFTIQTLIDGNPDDQTATTSDHAYSFNGSGNYFNFRIVKASQGRSAAESFCWIAQGIYMYFHAPNNQYSFATGIQDFDNKKAMMFPDTTIPTEYAKDGTYGAQRLYNEFDSMSIVTDSGYGLGNINAGNEGFVGTVKFFRYYDRVLTEEEIIRNRNADAVRYFGALGVTNVLVQTKYGDVESDAVEVLDEAPGAYTVEGTWTFSATRVKDRLGDLKDVAGYYTEELDALGNWTNKTWHEGKTAYTYDATSPACVRLTWSVMPPGLILIVR
ncbi:MAG: hypothetical protein IJ173_03500 [Kiritimatiellae bacterium]|nr:hypothetical protein [Kiritimatiellia bacterium]